MSLIQGTGGGLGGAGAPGGSLAGGAVFSHTISQSLKLDDSSGGHLTISSASPTATNRKKVAISCWVKRSTIGTEVNTVFWASAAGLMLQFFADNTIYIYDNNAGGWQSTVTDGGRLFRDTSAWYHLALIIDTTKDSASERAKFYINGRLQTLNSYPGADTEITWHTGSTMKIGNPNDTTDLAGYIAEFISIDGQDVLISDFGETVGGVWTPKGVSGLTLGNAGFYLKFDDNSDIGNDSGSNNIDFTASNLVASDVVPDSPTNNMAVLSAVNRYTNASGNDVREGGLEERGNSSGYAGTVTFDATDTDGYYFEVTHTGTPGGGCTHGMMNFTDSKNQYGGVPGDSDRSGWWGVYRRGAGGSNQFWYYLDGVETATLGVAGSANDVWMYLIKDGKFYIGRNGTWFNSADPSAGTGHYASGLTGTDWTIFSGNGYNVTGGHKIRVDRNLWDHGAASYKEIKTSNIADPTIGPGQNNQADDFFETMLYSGNGAEQHIGADGARHPVDTITIANSLKFEPDDEPALSKSDFGTQTNTKKMTISVWVKRASLGARTNIIFAKSGSSAFLQFDSNDKITWNAYNTGYTSFTSDREFKDISAWYHIVAQADSQDQTGANIHKVYVNGELISGTTSGSFVPDDTATMLLRNGVTTYIGDDTDGDYHFDGYLAEMNVIDGSIVDPTEFGQVGANGYWIPKTISGLTYGTNGFRLTFQNSSYLGYDYQTSDRSTTNDFTISGGGSPTLVATDQVIDSPTQNFATFDPNRLSGSQVTITEGNLKAERTSTGFGQAYSNLVMTTGKFYAEFYLDVGNSGVGIIAGDTIPGSNKYLGQDTYTYAYYFDGRKVNNNSYTSYGDSYTVAADGSSDIVGVMIDADKGEISFTKNGTVQNSGVPAFSGVTGPFRFAIASEGGIGSGNCFHIANFGQDDTFNGLKTSGSAEAADGNGVGKFYDTPPTGFLALMDDNIPKAGIESPDFVWIKERSGTTNHYLFDTVRGVTKNLHANTGDVEATDADSLLSFGNQGFTVGSNGDVNGSTDTYVAWNWKASGISPTQTYEVKVVSDSGNKYRFDDFGTSAITLSLQEGGTYTFDQSDSSNATHPLRFSTTSDGTHNSGSEYTTGVTTSGTPGSSGAKTVITVAHGAPTLYYYCSSHSGMGGQANTTETHGSTNLKGSIQSVVSASQDAGFSIVSWTGTGVGSNSVGHGLTQKPDMVICKARTSAGANYWHVNHKDLTASDYNIFLHLTSAESDVNTNYAEGGIGLGNANVIDFVAGYSGANNVANCNNSGSNFIAYCFHSVEGFSKVGSYTGNFNADGPFIYTGFRPAWLMLKRTDSADGWLMRDSKRDTHNVTHQMIGTNATSAEYTDTTLIDFVSNGFKLRHQNSLMNASGGNFIYLAFAEAPFKFANAR